MKHLKELLLIVLFSVNYVNAAIPHVEQKKKVINYEPPVDEEVCYDTLMLRKIEDSLKLLDIRNSIVPEIDEYADQEIFFNVKIFTQQKDGDKDNIYVSEKGRKKNRCIGEAFNLATMITQCACSPENILVTVTYFNDKDEEAFLATEHNISDINAPCKFVFAAVEE